MKNCITISETASNVLKDVYDIEHLTKHRSTARRPHSVGCAASNSGQSRRTFESRFLQIIHASGKRSLTTSTLSFMRSAAALLPLLFLAPCIAADLPEPPAAGVILSSVSASRTHSCGISDQGRLYCWGDGSGGQLG
ncbi:MAG: hypothetical protein K0U66_08400, partial [Gammaproteobacteria bacterium]|nr:hypothetical protein [Gammaproteobacteria bacterium]